MPPKAGAGTQMSVNSAKRLGSPCAVIISPLQCSRMCPARYAQMGWGGRM